MSTSDIELDPQLEDEAAQARVLIAIDGLHARIAALESQLAAATKRVEEVEAQMAAKDEALNYCKRGGHQMHPCETRYEIEIGGAFVRGSCTCGKDERETIVDAALKGDAGRKLLAQMAAMRAPLTKMRDLWNKQADEAHRSDCDGLANQLRTGVDELDAALAPAAGRYLLDELEAARELIECVRDKIHGGESAARLLAAYDARTKRKGV